MSESDAAKALFFEALALMDASNFPDAELRLREAQKLAPDHTALLTNLALVLLQQGKRTEARDVAARAIALNPDNLEALLIGAECHAQDGHLEDALAAYDRIAALDPEICEVHINRGNALNNLGRPDEALAAYDRALALAPQLAEGWLGRGNALGRLRRFDDALAAYEKALAANPKLAEAWVGRGNALCEGRCYEDALVAYDRAVGLAPDLAAAWFGRGNVLDDLKRHDEALAAYDKAIALDAGFAGAWIGRGNVLRQLKRSQESAAAYRQALKLGGDTQAIGYFLAALGAEPPPAAPPERFVANLFDSYADNFDRDLIENLKYRTPIVLADAIKRHAPPDAYDILDLGCGTGLAGAYVRALKRSLIGVDLSANMLLKAEARGIYDRLVCSDLTEFLQTQDGAFDIAIAADVFVYLGDLSLIFPAVRRALRERGLFGFSVEGTTEGDFVLKTTLRYAHSSDYLRRLAARHRFVVESIEPQIIRRDAGTDISGYLALMRCA